MTTYLGTRSIDMQIWDILADAPHAEEITFAYCSRGCLQRGAHRMDDSGVYLCGTGIQQVEDYEFDETCANCGKVIEGTDNDGQIVEPLHPVFEYDRWGNSTIVGYRTLEDQEAYLSEW
jgi:hypothetical protein